MARRFRIKNARPKRVTCPTCKRPALRLAQYNTRDTETPLVETQWKWIDRGIVTGPQVVEAYTSGGTLVRGEVRPGPQVGYHRVAAYPVHKCE